METPAAKDHDPVERFWDKYIECLEKQRVNPEVHRWYVLRCEQYIRSSQDRRLKDHTARDVTRHLEGLGRTGRMADWQFQQVVDALHILFSMLQVPWPNQVDWGHWQDSARSPLSYRSHHCLIPAFHGATSVI